MSPVEKDQTLTSSSLGSSMNKIPHSQSTPGVSGSKTPPATPRRGGKMLNVRIQMLDDSVTLFQVQSKADGSVLFEQVCKQLNLLEADYFGLEYQEGSTKHWLDLEKPLNKQIGLSLVEPLMRFCVKFYTPDPAQLEEEYTRYLFCLQVKRDLAHGHMQCNDNTAALMASYIVQAECGDYSADDYPDHTYLSSHKFAPHQDREMEIRIMESHKRHIGQSPAEADLNLLETARRCELYGVKMHPAKDPEGVPLNLSVAHMGVLVFQNYTKINTFSWAKIRKLSFKRKKFLIKLHPEGYGYFKDIVEFIFETRNDCKSFWKKCVENHGFFRCFTVKRLPRQRTKVLSRGSSFRYSGKTQKQMVEFVRENFVKRQTFQRSQSFRHTGLSHSTISNVGSSISAHPLLPLANSEATSLVDSLSPNAVRRQVAPGEVSSAQAVHPTTVTTTTSDITSITSSQRSYSVNDPGQRHSTVNNIIMYPNVVCTRPCHRINVMRSTTCYDSEYDTDKSYTSSKFSEPYRDIRCQSSQTDLILIDRPYPSLLSWQRSSSCKEFNSSSRSGSGGTPLVDNEEVNSSFDRNSPLDHHRITKIFSSSYPGTTSSLSTESGSDRKLEKADSVRRVVDPADDLYQDDVSQDSYELLEKEEVFNVNVSDDDKDDNDEIFYADNDIREEHMQEIEKRLGYLEPKYRGMEFNKFNEICKKEMASRSKEQIFVDSPMRFIEFENKSDTVAGHVPVERTKSDSYMSAPKPKSHRLLHQKSIDLTPMDSYEPTAAAKFDLNIPYTLHKRQAPDTSSPNEVKWSTVVCGSDHYSQDSGLSLSTQSTGNVSVENDSPVDLDKLLLNKYHDDVVTTSKSTELIQMAYKSSSFNESDVCAARRAAAADKPHKLKSCHSADSMPTSRSKRIYYQPLSADYARHRKKVDVIKIEPTAAVCSENSKELIIIEYSRDGKGKKLKKDGSGGSAENKNFVSSSGVSPEKQVVAKPPANVFKSSAVKVKIASALALNSGVGGVHVVPNFANEPSKMDVNALSDIVSKSVQSFPKLTCSESIEGAAESGIGVKDEEQVVPEGQAKSVDKNPSLVGSNLKNALFDLVSADRTSEAPQEPKSAKAAKINRFQSLASKIAAFDAFTDNIKIADKSTAELPRKKLPEKIQLSNKREKSPVLFARLGLSESSAFPSSSGQGHSQRRAVSLDSPVVSLHRLPLVTSFSSKDDTVDDPEDGVGPEEKPIRWWDDHINETVVRCMADMVEITVADMSEEKRDSVTSLSPNKTPERRRSSTRQERLDSFKKLKNFEMEVWESNDLNAAAAIDFEHKDFVDETFAEPPVEVEVADLSRRSDGKTDIKGFTDDDSVSVDESADSSAEIPFKELNSLSSDEAKRTTRKEQNTIAEHDEEQHSPLKSIEELRYSAPCLSPEALAECSDVKLVEERRDGEHIVSHSEALAEDINHAELINKLGCIEIPPKQDSKRNRLSVESSGSSSLDDPPHMDDTSGNMADDEDVTSSPLPPTPDASYSGMYLIGYGIYGMSRTLSRISEQSTSERSEVDDELSTKHSTQSASFDDSIISSDYCQPSLCSDAMDSLPDLPPLPEEYAFEIPPPAVDDVDWPSPKSEERTPVGPQPGRFEDDEDDEDDDAKTIHNEDDDDRDGAMTDGEEEAVPRRPHSTNKPRLSLGDDTSAGVSTSEFSSNATIVYHYDNVCPPPEFVSKADYSDEYDSPFTDDSDESKFFHRPPGHLFELPRSTGVQARPKGRLAHGPSSLDANTGMPKTKNTTRARCHSYYSLPRSPPSDGSSSSTQDSPNVPNTIPRASRRRRYTHTLKRKAKIIQITKV